MKDSFSNETVTHEGVGGEILNGHPFEEKRQEELKAQVRDPSYKHKSKFVLIHRECSTLYLEGTKLYKNVQNCWETPYKIDL